MEKYGTFKDSEIGYGCIYKLKRPLHFSKKKYRELKFNPNVGIELYVNMTYPPQYVIYALRLSLKGNKDV